MFRIFIVVIAASGLFVSAARAQTSANSPEEFCATSPTDLLLALEGNWTLAQGPGVMKAAGMELPLPPPPPVSLNLEFLPEVGVGFLSGQGQQMILMPMLPGLVDGWTDLLPKADKEKYGKTNNGCDWKSLRSIIGTNTYVLEGNLIVMNNKPTYLGKSKPCIDPLFNALDEKGNETPLYYLLGIMGGRCREFQLPPGEMSMTIVARFNTPYSGFGHVYFEGKKGPSRFAANAPLELFR